MIVFVKPSVEVSASPPCCCCCAPPAFLSSLPPSPPFLVLVLVNVNHRTTEYFLSIASDPLSVNSFFFFFLSIFPSQSFFQPLLTLTSKRTRPDQSGPSRLQLLSFTPFPHPLFLSPSSLRIVRPSSSSDRPASSPLSSPFFDFVLGFFSIVFSVYCAVFTFSPSAYNIPSPEAYPRYDPSVLNQTTQQFEQLQTKGTRKSHISLLFTITCFWRPYFRFAAPFALPHILPSSVLERACTASLIHPALA